MRLAPCVPLVLLVGCHSSAPAVPPGASPQPASPQPASPQTASSQTASPAATSPQATSPQAASPFGFYLLAMMWKPPSCSLTLHGLWPNFTDEQSRGQPRAWPQFCGAYAHCEHAEDASCAPTAPVPAELAPLAPEYVHGTLATHEWSKHGSCTALGAMDYFAAEISAIHMVHHDALHSGDYAPADLQRVFGIPAESVVLGCDAHCQLTQVGFCLAKDAGDHPTGPTPCTQNVTTSDYDNGCVTRRCVKISVSGCP